MKTYDRVKIILEENEQARNSDKYLIWKFWVQEGKATLGAVEGNMFRDGIMYESNFMLATSPESIRRSRQKVQENHPELMPTSSKVLLKRKQKQDTKGTFVYREDTEQKKFL